MKKLSILLVLLTLLLCSCMSNDFFASFGTTTADTTVVTPPVETTSDATTPSETTSVVTTPDVTTPNATTPDETTPGEPPHEHVYDQNVTLVNPTCINPGFYRAMCACGTWMEVNFDVVGEHTYGEAVITKAPTCGAAGEQTETCTVCGATKVTSINAAIAHTYEESVVKAPTCIQEGQKMLTCSVCGDQQTETVAATGIHTYLNAVCTGCGDAVITSYPMPSNYDADGDGKNDVYNFSKELMDGYQNGVHVWAGDYDTKLSKSPSSSSAGGFSHWYIVEYSSQTLVYKVTVPETGVYEMILHFRLKDEQVRGTKYTINGGTDNEQVFSTSYGYSGMPLDQMRDADTLTTYMYGITVNLVAGENIIKIEHASECPKSQHYRDFYFVKVGDYHAHSFTQETVTKQATCNTAGEKVLACACGEFKTESIPATYEHVYVNDVCIGCGKIYVPAGILEYSFLYNDPGFAGGTITFLPESSETYTFYWANANGKLANYTMLYSDTFTANVEAQVTIQSFTAIPTGATRVIAENENGSIVYSYTIPESRRFDAKELYVFGAISDTHQGIRYGSPTIPYNHFINASKVLYEKGAIAIGICGDFSYNNTEDEYALHEKAVKELYATMPDLPIFTTSGNHESKYTGFSYDWYMQYSRDVVDYDSNLDYIYFDGNELDYVVELPDGSVMIYFHQVAYDYGKSTSRLVSDEQLVWLEARLEQYKDKTVFFFFHSFLDEEVGDATTSGNEYGYPIISSTVEYKKFTELFTKYKNVIYFSGHSHWTFDSQFVEPKPGKTNYDKNIDNKDGTFATMVHIPACSQPRVLVGSGNGRSEGYIVHVYEDCIVLEGYEFVQGETFAYATYIIQR